MTGDETVLLVAAVGLGASVGSFLNVVISRLPRGAFVADGLRSICANPECRRPIPFYYNVPVVAWLWLRGRARCCGARIGVRYPVVEALTAALFVLLWRLPPGGPVVHGGALDGAALAALLLHLFFVSNLVANTFIDMEHRILPDVLTKSALLVGLLGALIVPGFAGRFFVVGLAPAADSLLFSLVGAAAGFALTQGVRLAARIVFRREAMGYGDVKLMAAIGAFLGWRGVLLTFFLGCVLGAVVGVVHRWLTKDAYICFGPFLAAAAVVTLFVADDLLRGLGAFQDWQQTSAHAPWLALLVAIVSVFLLVVLVRRGRAP